MSGEEALEKGGFAGAAGAGDDEDGRLGSCGGEGVSEAWGAGRGGGGEVYWGPFWEVWRGVEG